LGQLGHVHACAVEGKGVLGRGATGLSREGMGQKEKKDRRGGGLGCTEGRGKE